MNTNDISIDLETLGTAADSAILAIGAAAFDRTTGKVRATYYVEIDGDSATRGRSVNYSTVAWWITEGHKAKDVFTSGKEKRNLATALMDFAAWCRNVGAGVPRAWGNGATFDITILEHAYINNTVGLQAPWHFMNIRDVRTIVEAAEEIVGFDRKTVAAVGTAHNAVDDAVYQANLVSAAYAALRGASKTLLAETTKAKLKTYITPAPAAADDDL